MKRKIAFGLTVAATLFLMAVRLGWLAFIPAAVTPWIVAAIMAVIAVLCFSRTDKLHMNPPEKWSSVCGWFCTFCGAVLTLSMLFDIVCWLVYKQVPPPNTQVQNQVDLIALWLMLLCGVAGGVLLVLQGFQWMSNAKTGSPLIPWLAITPALWMWFRLARYEISYASTINISESFYDFCILIFASLFFLQFARFIAHIGKIPQSGLLIFALCAAMITVSGAPAAFIEVANDQPLGELLMIVTDTVIGAFALIFAAMQIFSEKPVSLSKDKEAPKAISDDSEAILNTETQPDPLAWTAPEKDETPVTPAFHIDSKLPPIDQLEDVPASQPAAPTSPPAVLDLSIDELLAQIQSEQDSL